MEKTIERLVNGNIQVTIPIRLKYDGCKTVIHQPEVEQAELDPETMFPLQKAVIQGFQYRDMLESARWQLFPNWHRKLNRNAPSSSGH